ncbi:Ig-like domain repeat protein [Streptomyces niveus]|uniref:Ig-like domain repeat protein n=1 Tax=Streptomyces niveus TaxID=193462 RepID=A0ABZ1ZZG2_STRNV|nr:Ig-like domain repeat protein [Streptomyces niveus]
MASSNTTVTSAPDPSVFGQSVTFTATVQPEIAGGPTPTGSVDFIVDGVPVTTAPLDPSGQAQYTTSALEVGLHGVEANYSGDAEYDPSTGADTQEVALGNTTTTLAFDPEPSVCGETVTFTAQVTAVPPSAGTPTGLVSFIVSDDGPVLTAPVDMNGQAQVSISDLDVGFHQAAAFYTGDADFDGSNSPLTLHVVNHAPVSVAVTADPSPSVCGGTVTLCATVAPTSSGIGNPSGSVTFTGPGGLDETVPLDAGGMACVTTTVLETGTLAVSYGGDGCYASATGTLDVTVSQAASTTTVSVDPSPSVCGETVTVCATVTAVAPGSGTPTGTVTFTAPGGLNQTVPLDAGGEACVTTSTLTSGTITATYNGDGCFTSSTGTAPVTVNQASSAVSVSVDPNPSVCGQPVTVCATVTAVAPGSGTPTGTITFTAPGGLNQTIPLDASGEACVTTSTLTSGTITATYNGDGCFTSSTGTVDVTVNPAASAVTVTVDPNPSVCGQPVTVCATVTAVAPGSGTPTGAVTFTAPGGLNQTIPLNAGGEACLTTSTLTSGTITATYNGDGCFTSSTGTAPVTVNQASSAVSVSVDPNPSVCGETVTVCATVTAVAPGSGTPTGTVTFTAPGGLNQTIPLNAGGEACLTTSTLTSGTITATYNGDGCFTSSTGTVDVAVNPAASAVTVTVDPNPSVCGETVTVCATVTAVAPGSGTPTGAVTFTGPGGLSQTVPLDAGGEACVTTTTLETGTVTVTYTGDTCFLPSTGTAVVTVDQASSMVSVTVDPNPSVCGETVTVCATVTAVAPGSGTPTGNLSFLLPDGSTQLAGLDASGTACLTTSSLTSGTVSASYNGDSCFLPSTGTAAVTVDQASSMVSVTVTPNPSVCGETVTVCATVTAVPPGSGTPTGTITFTGPGGLNVTLALDAGGEACLTTSSLTSGTYSATYNGDSCFAGSDGLFDVTVNQAASTTTVTVDPNPSVCGETVTVCATVTAVAPGSGTPTGTVTFTAPGGLNQTAPLDAGGEACVTTTVLKTGTVTVTYSGDTCLTGSTGTFDVTVNQAASTTTVTVDPNPSVCGQPVTVCATVTAVAPGSGTPTGTITFTAPGGLNQTIPLNAGGEACLTTSTLTSGPVTAVYNGDGCFTSSTGTAPVTVNQASSAVSVSVDPNPSVCGQPVTVCATVTAVAPGSGTPTGTITFTAPGGLNQTIPLNAGGEACLTTSTLTSGTITATYNGDGCFTSSTGTAPVTVNHAASTTTLTANPNPSVCGQPVTVCATVTAVAPGSGTPTGTVTFTGPGGLNVTLALDAGGEACLTTSSLTSGTYSATYNGDGCFTSSTGTAPVTVNHAASTTTVTVNPNPSVCGQPVTVCATVTAAAGGTPTGTVTFTAPGGLNQTVPLDASGKACVTTSSLTSGTVTAVYNGDGCFSASTGTAPVTVNHAASTTTVTVNPNPSVCGQPVTVCATVTAVAPGSGTPTGTVTFTGAGLNVTVPLDAGGEACLTTSTLATGTVTAVYNGDGCFTSSTGTAPVTVNHAASTTTVTVNPNPSVCGQPVTVCATVKAMAPGSGTPTGTVTFTGPGGLNQTVPVNAGGTACVTTSTLATGTVTAVYNGDGCFTPSKGATGVTVNNAQTATSLTITPSPAACGGPVTFCATVTTVAPGSGTPTGTVTFSGPGGFSQTVALNASGKACVTTNAVTGGTVTAVYNGDTCHSPSAATGNLTVNSVATTLTAAPAQIRLRANGSFVIPSMSATLKVTSSAAPLAGQLVTFKANTTLGPIVLGTALTNASGVATLAPPTLTVPSTVITATSYTASFAGTSCYASSSVSAPLALVLFPLLP